jgi:hypothetical protein
MDSLARSVISVSNAEQPAYAALGRGSRRPNDVTGNTMEVGGPVNMMKPDHNVFTCSHVKQLSDQ